MLEIATVLKPQGVKGELKLECESDTPEVFRNFREVFVGGTPFRMESVRFCGNNVFLKLETVNDRTAAETLRGKRVEIPRENAPALPAGRYYVADLIGAEVATDGGETLGVLKEVLQYGAADVYVVRSAEGKEISFPALKRVLRSIDPDAKRITVEAKSLIEVAVCED